MKINPTTTPHNMGGKGYQLTQLAAFCDVPPFFVVSFDDAAELQNKANQDAILKHFTDKGFDLVSVRSSATVEDSNKASFAGMFETSLNVTKAGLIAAIEKVLKSVDSARIAEYAKLNNIPRGEIKMRVVIQKMVDSRISGVVITRETMDCPTLLIEAVHGLGEALVGGLVTPDTFKIDRKTFKTTYKNIGHQTKMITRAGEVRVPFFLASAAKMTDAELVELGKACIIIEQKLGYKSADIEWAYEGDKLYILQARPFVAV